MTEYLVKALEYIAAMPSKGYDDEEALHHCVEEAKQAISQYRARQEDVYKSIYAEFAPEENRVIVEDARWLPVKQEAARELVTKVEKLERYDEEYDGINETDEGRFIKMDEVIRILNGGAK